MSLIPTVKLTNEVCQVITDIERAGLKIDTKALEEVEAEFKAELHELDEWLQLKVKEVMGDTPLNLDSSDDKSKLIYSRVVKDKSMWKKVFNIRKDPRTGKMAFRFNVKTNILQRKITEHSTVLRKTTAIQCNKCKGYGKYFRFKKDGALYKKPSKCSVCDGGGIQYIKQKKIAGFKIVPTNIGHVTANGFKTDKHVLKKVADKEGGEVAEFIAKLVRRGAIVNYLSTFVDGIKRGLGKDDFIHFKINQAVTATGRTSSSDPNFQNMPVVGDFPIRRAVISRFVGGRILEGDFKQLEFRVAGYTSGCQQVYKDIRSGEDVHQFTADTIGIGRREAKAHTFKPLYGGKDGTEKEKAYYNAFLKKYEGVYKWHVDIIEKVIKTGIIVLPSGREYDFGVVRRQRNGNVADATKIKNYPVQGFATGDLLPIALVYCWRKMSENALQSVICNTVHDSIVLDCHPDEVDICVNILKEAMFSLKGECERRYNIDYDMPVGIELKLGPNWLEMDEVFEGEL